MTFGEKRKSIFPASVILIAAGLVLRLILLFRVGTLWNDEAFSRHFARLPLARMLEPLRFDVHPPLHAVILHFWMLLFGDGIYAVRGLSLLFALVGLGAFALLAKGLADRRAAFLAVLLAAVSPLMVYYGVDGRMYGAVFALASLSSLLFWKLWKGDARMRRPWFWVSLALALTHVSGVLVLAGQALFLLRHPERRPLFKKLLPSFAIIAAAFALWLIPAAAARFSTTGREWQFQSDPEALHAEQALTYWLWLGKNGLGTTLVFIFALLYLLAGVMRRGERRPYFHFTEEGEFLAWWFVCVFVPFLLLPKVVIRYLIAAVPPLYLLLCRGFMASAKGRWYATALGAAAILVFSAPGLVAQLANRAYNWDKDVDWIDARAQPGDRVVYAWFSDRLSIEATEAAPFGRRLDVPTAGGLYPYDDALTDDERLAAHAGTLAIKPSDLERLTPLFKDATRVFLIPSYQLSLVGGGFAGPALNDWLLKNGWYLLDHRDDENRTQGVWLLVRK